MQCSNKFRLSASIIGALITNIIIILVHNFVQLGIFIVSKRPSRAPLFHFQSINTVSPRQKVEDPVHGGCQSGEIIDLPLAKAEIVLLSDAQNLNIGMMAL